MADPAHKTMSLAEFLVWDSPPNRHYELICGHPVAMAPPTAAHGTIVGNLAGSLFSSLSRRHPCRAQIEVGIRIPHRRDTWYQADIAVTCRPPAAGEIAMPEPLIVVEVLSSSTENHDRKLKLPDYRLLPSVAEVVLIDSQRMYCEAHRRADGNLWFTDLLRDPEAVLKLDSIGLETSLEHLYANVVLEA